MKKSPQNISVTFRFNLEQYLCKIRYAKLSSSITSHEKLPREKNVIFRSIMAYFL